MANKTPIATTKAPAAIGPYSQAVIAGDLLFVSGQIPLNPATGQLIEGGVEQQTEQCLKNLAAILSEAGTSPDQVVRTTIFLKDMNDFGKVNEIYGSFFKAPFPARACVEVARLPKDVAVEIDAIALISL